jgi:L-fucose isomerase-like protein
MGEGALSQIARPRLGVLLVTSGWFRDVGLQGAGSETSSEVAAAGAALVARFGEFADTVCDGVLFSVEEAGKAAREIRAAEVDGLLLVPLMWCEDAIPRAALSLLEGLPLLLWTWSPTAAIPAFLPFQSMLRGSGAVCTMQLSGMLRREGRPFQALAGHAGDETVFAEIRDFALAFATRRLLRGARVGLLPFPCDQMSTTWVDEFALRSRYGVQVRHLELERFRRAAAEVSEGELAALRKVLKDGGAEVKVDGRNLAEGQRYALAMKRVAAEEGLRALAMNDVIAEMHESFGLRPCLCDPGLSAAGLVVSMEADLGAAVAMLALRSFTGDSPFYTEPLSLDWEGNTLVMGHAGYHDTANADPDQPLRIVNDIEYENSDRFTGAASWFKYRPGPVTGVNCVWNGERLRLSCVEGESLPGPPALEGNCHLRFRPDVPLVDFIRRAVESGVSQHWVFVGGHRAEALRRLAAALDFGFASIDPS